MKPLYEMPRDKRTFDQTTDLLMSQGFGGALGIYIGGPVSSIMANNSPNLDIFMLTMPVGLLLGAKYFGENLDRILHSDNYIS